MLVICLCIWKWSPVLRTKGCRVETGVADLVLLFNFKALIFLSAEKKKEKERRKKEKIM